jgi:hypothetical protein
VNRRRMIASQMPPTALTEKDFTRQVRDLAEMLGWKFYHPWLSIHSPRGFPDLALCKPPRPGVEFFTWRPSDIERISAVLLGQA